MQTKGPNKPLQGIGQWTQNTMEAQLDTLSEQMQSIEAIPPSERIVVDIKKSEERTTKLKEIQKLFESAMFKKKDLVMIVNKGKAFVESVHVAEYEDMFVDGRLLNIDYPEGLCYRVIMEDGTRPIVPHHNVVPYDETSKTLYEDE